MSFFSPGRRTKIARPPSPPRRTQFPTGPKALRLEKMKEYVGGPGAAPAAFTQGLKSTSEWYLYWALSKVFKSPENPRAGPPFLGATDGSWRYQSQFGARFTIGGAVLDFEIAAHDPPMFLRLQSERFHVATLSGRHAFDEEQKRQVQRYGFLVIDIYEEDIIHDQTGVAAIMAVRNALNGIEALNPIVSGTSLARPM